MLWYPPYFSYGSEIWDVDCNDQIEKDPAELVQIKLLKWLLGVNKHCSNNARLSQSRSLGFLVWCGRPARSRFALARSRYALKSSTCEQVYNNACQGLKQEDSQ